MTTRWRIGSSPGRRRSVRIPPGSGASASRTHQHALARAGPICRDRLSIWTVIGPPNGARAVMRTTLPGAIASSVRYRSSSGSSSSTCITSATVPGSSSESARYCASFTEPLRLGMGAPCGSVAGSPIVSAMRSIRSLDAACSRRSASSCTSSHRYPILLAPNVEPASNQGR